MGGFALMICAFMVTADVLSRKFLGVTMRGSDEITGYVFAGVTTWAYAHCLFTRSNIRIDVAYLKVGKRVRGTMDIVGLGLLSTYIFVLSRSAWDVLHVSWSYNYTSTTPLAVPLWVPQSVWFGGLAFMMLCCLVLMAASLRHLIAGRWQALSALIGVRSVEQDIKEETHI
jgi:TRAP-type C4-dicarboxylate transport system permease small subunit